MKPLKSLLILTPMMTMTMSPVQTMLVPSPKVPFIYYVSTFRVEGCQKWQFLLIFSTEFTLTLGEVAKELKFVFTFNATFFYQIYGRGSKKSKNMLTYLIYEWSQRQWLHKFGVVPKENVEAKVEKVEQQSGKHEHNWTLPLTPTRPSKGS